MDPADKSFAMGLMESIFCIFSKFGIKFLENKFLNNFFYLKIPPDH